MSSLTIAWEREGRRPGGLRRLLGRGRSGAVAALALVGAVLLTPNRAALRRLAEMPLTCVAVGMIDTAAWQAPAWVGWLVTGLSLMFVEHLISDDEPVRPA